MKLSLSMIVKDEEAHLGHCLDSVRGLVDEIIVVDTGSTDATAALAAGRGAQVHTFPWTGDFSAARNASLAHATGDWVLVLDADEAVDGRDHAALRAACQGADAYRVLVRSYLPDGAYTLMDAQARPNPGGYAEGAEWPACGDTRAVRLFRRLPGVAFRGRIHESVEASFPGPLPDLDTVIHHFGFTLAHRVEAKKPVYLNLAREDARERPEDLLSLFNLVIQAATAEDWDLAALTAERYRALAREAPPTLLLTQATALQRSGRHEEALRVFAELPGSLPARVGRGVSLERLGRREEARVLLEACLREAPGYATARLDLADLHARAGEPAAARALLLAGVEAAPSDASLWGRLVRLGVEDGQLELAVKDAWGAIQHCPQGGGGDWHKLVGLFLLRLGAMAEGRQVLALGLAAFPGHPDLTRLLELC
ncbi:glycosyltransferase [Mesoterricola silvestris]|uniref:Glycosyltransferase 2-like domain-containing protein n=1 Tax=Mesoterricola silvestris TaxID=2927979 RepID=A0AA48GEE3_9BACT|nr:glycosyltransferase [Mesoterricola silvestris]BDU71006.1 hypothetical protein METEAL_01800 [Mesoterricola silvestris]